MIASFPHLKSNRIERDDVLEQIIKSQEAVEDKRLKSLKEAEELQKYRLSQIRAACALFKAHHPDQWKIFESAITDLHSLAVSMDGRSPVDLLREQKEYGIIVDSAHYGLTKAYLAGKIEILESLKFIIQIDFEKIKRENASQFRSNNFVDKILGFVIRLKSKIW